MKLRRRLAIAGALTGTVAMAAAVGASANPVPPKGIAARQAALPSLAAPEPAPAVPTFKNGLAQAVFTTDSKQWVHGTVWVQTDFDSDGDGKPDRMHADYTLPPETQTDGLKVPIIYEDSPYFAGTADDYSNWIVDHELGAQPPPRPLAPFWDANDTSQAISSEFNTPWISRGFGVVHSESPGTGYSDGCPSSGGRNETLGATAIIDWLTGRRQAYSTRTGDVEVPAMWSSGKVGMMGTSYNGTLPEAAATTGVQGLEAIVPISAISDWYDYYRANGMVRAPHSRPGGTGLNGFLGEDLDVLIDDVYSRLDETGQRTICRRKILDTGVAEDRLSGNRNAFWDERDYMKDVQNVHAAALIAHGNNDFNVMTKNAAQFYDALKRQGVPHMFYFHQGGHGGAPPDVMVNRWFSRYLYGVQNGVENLPRSWVVRETASCPARQTTASGDQSNVTNLAVADSSVFPLGFTVSVPVTNATGTVTTVDQLITDIPDATHITLAAAVATAAGQKVAGGATVFMMCQKPNPQGFNNPTPYSEWPDPASAPVVQKLLPGGAARGALTFAPAPAGTTETLTDDATIADTALLDAASSPHRLVYQSNVLTKDVRISGTPAIALKLAFSKPKANLSAALVSYPANGGAGTILTRGWKDPENRNSDYASDPIIPGTFYDVSFDMQAKDAIVPAGNRLGLMIFSSDNQYTIRPAAGTQLTVDLAKSSFTLPIVGGASRLATATGNALVTGDVSGTVPATLALTLGNPASFGAFTPGTAKTYTATQAATVTSTAGDATLTVADPSTNAPGHLVNGAFSLRQPLMIGGSALPAVAKTYAGPVSHDPATVTFTQAIGADDPLRTGSYSKTLTFTLSTTNP